MDKIENICYKYIINYCVRKVIYIMVNKVISETDKARVMIKDPGIKRKYNGLLAQAVRFIERNQICEVGLWQKFVDVFRRQEDFADGKWYTSWRSEFWGKMMRGASMVVAYTGDDNMYRILENSVRDILTTEDDLGRISGYSVNGEFDRWDIWGRKYVMLGMMYFLEISKDGELNKEIIASMQRQADYIIAHVGPGKLDIRDCSRHWEGLNSCSVLEPIVRLYRLTGEKRYLDFAEYIVSTGFIKSADLIELAYADEIAPYQYPVVKAYEMMSCFEGLLQYYYVTGIEKYRTAVLNFGRRIIGNEISIIGCSGCTHELFDHTAVKQTQTDYDGIVQETCVTVTWMKLASALLELSGDPVYADCIEQSFYNSYMGAMNIRRVPVIPKDADVVPQVLPFDSYSPLTADTRGRKVGGFNSFSDKTFYGCCACIGAAGAGVIPEIAVMRTVGGFVINYYEKGTVTAKTPAGNDITLTVNTEYPYDGRIGITVDTEVPESFILALRVPAWCRGASVSIGGNTVNPGVGYAKLEREWRKGDTVVLELPMTIKRILPPKDALNGDMFVAYRRGPIVLAADKRITDPDRILDIRCDADGTVEEKEEYCREIPEYKVCFAVELTDGTRVRLIDYASAGKTWTEESRCAAWLRRK